MEFDSIGCYCNSINNIEIIECNMKAVEPIDFLRFTAFILTIVIILYGVSKGLDTLELIFNIIYFVVIIVVLLYDNYKIFIE